MSKCGIRYFGWNWLIGVIVVGSLVLPTSVAMSQEASSDTATTTAAPADEAAKTETAGAQPAAAPATDAEKSDDAKAEQKAPASATAGTAPAGTTATGQTAASSTSTRTSPLVLALIIAALFVLPVLAGNFLAKAWKMPDHAWKFSLVLGTLAASILIVTFGEFKFGPDLAGGITLVYELADTSLAASPAAADGKTPGPTDAANDAKGGKGRPEFKIADLITALKERVDPTGTREVTIRPYGEAVEIIIPQQAQDELDYIKRRITDVGQLEFRITADPNYKKDEPIIEQAKLAPPAQKDVYLGGRQVAEWVALKDEELGNRVVTRMAGDVPEALVLIDPLNVTGDYLSSVTQGVDERGGPAVNFSFDRRGAASFRLLTSQNKPDPATGVERHLGIVLDKRLISAPGIRETISDHGQISGGAMDQKEVEYIIGILKAGALPASLNKTPISESVVSPTLGKVTIEKGEQAIFWSMVAVVVFMIVYYRFAGIVACIALSFNLLLVLALMVLIKGAFTLPGLAGLVLTIGMSVDANVLIYERIREELRSGAALRMAIRNGFSRAMSAIIDSNVTTIISGIALYAIGTDQVKGFAVTLILGILTSMFTAIFVARVIFDVAERRGWITQLRMLKLMSQPSYDFLGKRWLAIAASLVLIAVGMGAAVARGPQLFDIDFTGGTSVTFSLKSSDKMPITEVRDALVGTELKDKNLLVVERGETNTRYSIDTSDQSVENVQQIVKQTFGDKLMTYAVEVKDLKPFAEGEFSGTEATVSVNDGPDFTDDDGISYEALRERLRNSLAATDHGTVQPILNAPGYRTGSSARFKNWTVRLTGLDADAARSVLDRLQADMQSTPLFPMANKIGGRVSSDMQSKAVWAVVISLIGVIIYLWLRFQKVSYGLAAAIAVAHDVFVTIGLMALSYYIVSWVPALASALQIDAFQINLTIVAALLTIIGYSLNDTIVTFDRLREIKGKSPQLTTEMVNSSVNQCLSRTILTALTVFLTVVILYFFGGDGIHSFAFAFLVGVIAGTYSTVYIAAPVLLWLSGEKITATVKESPRVIERAG